MYIFIYYVYLFKYIYIYIHILCISTYLIRKYFPQVDPELVVATSALYGP